MTTILGIVANKGTPGVVLASDCAATLTRWDERGDIAIRRETKQDVQKIHIDEKNDIAVAMSGAYDNTYRCLLDDLMKGKIDYRKASQSGLLDELLRANLFRFGGRTWQDQPYNTLLVATRYDNTPKLWKCWQLGKIENIHYGSIGSGSEYALDYINWVVREEGIPSPNELSIRRAVDWVARAMRHANRDIHTSGLDIVVATPKDIECFGNKISSKVREAQEAVIKEIKQKYS